MRPALQSPRACGKPDRFRTSFWSPNAYWHGQVHEKSLSDAFPLRKTEGVGRATILGFVKAPNLLASSLSCPDVPFVRSLDPATGVVDSPHQLQARLGSRRHGCLEPG